MKLTSYKAVSLRKTFLMFAIGFIFVGNSVFASENILQAIQVEGVKDGYNIVLKSDNAAQLKKTVQSPNKIVLDLKGIRASKTINMIYNNTLNVDSVVVEPTGEDSLKIFVQANNIGNAEVYFNTSKAPLGVLGENSPIDNILKTEKNSLILILGLLLTILFGIFSPKRSKNEDKNDRFNLDLSQNLKQRELDFYKGGVNIRGNESTSEKEIRKLRSLEAWQPANSEDPAPRLAMNTAQKFTLRTVPISAKPKTANIDSIKFLDSMTRIYEKNMKKARINLT